MAGCFAKSILATGSVAFLLAGCGDTLIPTSDLPDATWDQVASNARGIGATAKRVSPEVGLVTYRGAPRDYISCRTDDQFVDTSRMGASLDIRATVSETFAGVDLDTQHVVTLSSGRADARSITFTDSTIGEFQDGIRCASTGVFEATISGNQ